MIDNLTILKEEMNKIDEHTDQYILVKHMNLS